MPSAAKSPAAASPSPSPLAARRERLAAALELTDELLLVGAGEPVPLPENTDQTYPFRAHTEYLYVSELDRPGGVVAYDPKRGPVRGWTSFVPDVTEAERVWEARRQDLGEALARLEPYLTTRRGRPIVNLGTPLRGVTTDPARLAAAREKFTHARRPKDADELEKLRRAATATAAGYAALREAIRPGVTERTLQIELETGFARAGAHRPGYGTIVGTGSNSAVLHFSPSQRVLKRGDFVLVDAGAEVDRYVIDVTRTYVVGGKPTPLQRDLFNVVLRAEEAAVARCVPGAEWKDVHLRAAVEMTAGLVDLKLMRGNAESLVEQGAHTVFFPHGLGHLVGLGVRDASGRLPGRQPFTDPALKNLRMDLPLQPGYVVTVEPGLYFIPAILNDPARRKQFGPAINWELALRYEAVGGVRIEDDILITEGQPENLTAAIPKGW